MKRVGCALALALSLEAGRDRVVPAHDAFVVPPGRPTCSLE